MKIKTKTHHISIPVVRGIKCGGIPLVFKLQVIIIIRIRSTSRVRRIIPGKQQKYHTLKTKKYKKYIRYKRLCFVVTKLTIGGGKMLTV